MIQDNSSGETYYTHLSKDTIGYNKPGENMSRDQMIKKKFRLLLGMRDHATIREYMIGGRKFAISTSAKSLNGY